MSLKIAAELFLEPPRGEVEKLVVVREYDQERDMAAVVEMERQCEVGQEQPSIITDLLGDPIGRIRNFPLHVMLVAEYGEEREIVGVIRACVKSVTRGKSVHVKLAYILGLRVSLTTRRLGIGTKLVQHMEQWCKKNGAEYAYMATDCTNQPSINLFTQKCAYVKFRTPTMLVHPVHGHYKPLGSGIAIVRLPPPLAESIYQKLFSNSEFFPNDIDGILSNNLTLGTFIALPKKSSSKCDLENGVLPPSYAILSVWNTKEVFKMQMKGVSALTYACCVGTRVLDAWMPWLRLPSIPDFFNQFGVYFLYGLHIEGKGGSRLMKSLCAFAHNMARDDVGCRAVVAEVGQRDLIREAIPHWRKFSWTDVWCIKKLISTTEGEKESGAPSDWIKSRSSSSVLFVDPRDN